MSLSTVPALPLFSFIFLPLFFTITHAGTFDVRNQCPYSVWAAGGPGGGKRLHPGQSWSITANPGIGKARIWRRTSCSLCRTIV
ncbi:hypothetical protein MRB53_020718 [Persea americana]|uniref:Uncharacterized protein n=1 Tax=Persea americana TaxID=3435 RepID=A0ACC2L2L2_PERAE|nr:hypothetical protein MRB53_020718 [Persea americana]